MLGFFSQRERASIRCGRKATLAGTFVIEIDGDLYIVTILNGSRFTCHPCRLETDMKLRFGVFHVQVSKAY